MQGPVLDKEKEEGHGHVHADIWATPFQTRGLELPEGKLNKPEGLLTYV